jgi:hypothetical protein
MIRHELGVIPPLMVNVQDAKRAITSTLCTPAPLTDVVIVPLLLGFDVRVVRHRPLTQSTLSS